MAKASIETISKTKTEEVSEKVYTLTLSEDEAKTLFALTGRIVGDFGGSTYAKHTTSVRVALADAGLPYMYFDKRFTIEGNDIRGKKIEN